MEDAATAEISRSQVWQWLRHGRVSAEDVQRDRGGGRALGAGYEDARALFEQVGTSDELVEFLTLPAYERSPWSFPGPTLDGSAVGPGYFGVGWRCSPSGRGSGSPWARAGVRLRRRH